jgi:hypothetical protein
LRAGAGNAPVAPIRRAFSHQFSGIPHAFGSGTRNGWRKPLRFMSYRTYQSREPNLWDGDYSRRCYVRGAALFAFVLLAVGCADEGEDGACSWLFAPASFVDAGQPGCTTEPAGERCDPSSGRCQNVCHSGEYLLTCFAGEVSRLAIPEEALQDPVVNAGRPVTCRPMQAGGEGNRANTEYCCQCER